MTWFKVHSPKVKTHRKFRSLDNAALGAWLRIRAEVDLLEGEPLPDRFFAAAIAQGDEASVVALLDVGLLDEDEDGTIRIHDLEDWGRAGRNGKPSDHPDRVAERVARHRAKQRGETVTPHVTPATPETPRTDQNTVDQEQIRPDARERPALVVACGECGVPVGQPCTGVKGQDRWAVHRSRYSAYQHGLVGSEPAPKPAPDAKPVWEMSADDPVIIYGRLTGKFASDDARDWINQIAKDHTDEGVTAAILAEWSADQTKRTLLGRVERRLKEDAYQRQQADQRATQQFVERKDTEHAEQVAAMRAADPDADRKAAERRRLIREGLAAQGLVAAINTLQAAPDVQPTEEAPTPAPRNGDDDANHTEPQPQRPVEQPRRRREQPANAAAQPG